MPNQLTTTRKNWAKWNMVNQHDELIIAHLNTATGEAIYKAIEDQWPFVDQRKSGIIPINHVLHYQTTNQKLKVGTPIRMETTLRLVAQYEKDEFRRVHLHGKCNVFAKDSKPAASADYWIALTKPFAQKGQRRLQCLPDALTDLKVHKYQHDDLPLKDLDAYTIADAQHQAATIDTFHINQTDMNHHVNTIVYLELAQDHIARLAANSKIEVANLTFRTLEVFYRKPFTAGEKYHIEVDLQPDDNTYHAAVRFRPFSFCSNPNSDIAVGINISGAL